MKAFATKHLPSIVLGGIMVTVGIFHFRSPAPFASIVPSFLPHKVALVLISGFFEILGGVGLMTPITRKAAAIGLILLYIAVFPANVNMAVNNIPIDGIHIPHWALLVRLPLQLVLIAWAFYCSGIRMRSRSSVVEG